MVQGVRRPGWARIGSVGCGERRSRQPYVPDTTAPVAPEIRGARGVARKTAACHYVEVVFATIDEPGLAEYRVYEVAGEHILRWSGLPADGGKSRQELRLSPWASHHPGSGGGQAQRPRVITRQPGRSAAGVRAAPPANVSGLAGEFTGQTPCSGRQ